MVTIGIFFSLLIRVLTHLLRGSWGSQGDTGDDSPATLHLSPKFILLFFLSPVGGAVLCLLNQAWPVQGASLLLFLAEATSAESVVPFTFSRSRSLYSFPLAL